MIKKECEEVETEETCSFMLLIQHRSAESRGMWSCSASRFHMQTYVPEHITTSCFSCTDKCVVAVLNYSVFSHFNFIWFFMSCPKRKRQTFHTKAVHWQAAAFNDEASVHKAGQIHWVGPDYKTANESATSGQQTWLQASQSEHSSLPSAVWAP